MRDSTEGAVVAPELYRTLLGPELYRTRQGVGCREILDVLGKTVKVDIYRDSVEFQSHARAKIWDGFQWNSMASVHWSNMETPENLHVKKSASTAVFLVDRAAVLEQVLVILRPREGG
jgi:hypothetical protein